MFSVDNFHTFMNSHYGLESDGRNLLWLFPHGDKNWKNIFAGFVVEENQHLYYPFWDSKGVIILHDQEPFDQTSLDIYKHQNSIDKNEDWRKHQPNHEVLLSNNRMAHLGWTIFCHSELNSVDVEFVKQTEVLDCYYFYHGLIARDWFRHWKHHGGISLDRTKRYRFLLYARDCTGSRQYRSQLLDDLLPIKSQIKYNWNQTQVAPSDSSANISVEDSQTTSIHLVAETVFDQQKIHLTEKIFKPMVMMQPFIVFAGAGALECLKNYGFKTFGHIWDESYDQISDHSLRYQKILNLIRDLSALDQKTLNQKLEQAKSIILHNHQRFFSNEFEDQMLNELRANMSHCLALQDEKTKQFPGGAAFYILGQRTSRGIDSVSLKKRCANTMMYLKTNDVSRYEAILRQYPDLCRILF